MTGRDSLEDAPRLRQIDVRMSDGSQWTYWAQSVSQFEQIAKTYRAINVGIPGASPAVAYRNGPHCRVEARR